MGEEEYEREIAQQEILESRFQTGGKKPKTTEGQSDESNKGSREYAGGQAKTVSQAEDRESAGEQVKTVSQAEDSPGKTSSKGKTASRASSEWTPTSQRGKKAEREGMEDSQRDDVDMEHEAKSTNEEERSGSRSAEAASPSVSFTELIYRTDESATASLISEEAKITTRPPPIRKNPLRKGENRPGQTKLIMTSLTRAPEHPG